MFHRPPLGSKMPLSFSKSDHAKVKAGVCEMNNVLKRMQLEPIPLELYTEAIRDHFSGENLPVFGCNS